MPDSFVFKGRPIGFKRVTPRGGGRAFLPKDYREYRDDLSTFIRAKFGHWTFDMPSRSDEKKRLEYQDKHRYKLTVIAYKADKRRADADNFSKTVCDAFEESGVIFNDEQFDIVTTAKTYDKDDPRIEVWIEQIDIKSFLQTLHGTTPTEKREENAKTKRGSAAAPKNTTP